MLSQPFDIDTIVRQVLSDLNAKGVSKVQNAEPRIKNQEKNSAFCTLHSVLNSKIDKATLQLPDSLVTLALLEGRLDGVREVVISPKAIVTPSVRDLLYKKEIRLQASGFRLQEETTEAQSLPPEVRSPKPEVCCEVWLALHQLKREPEMLLGFLQNQASLSKESFNCIVATTQAAAKRLAESEALRAIIVTNHSAAALVAANRHATIRAILGDHPEQTSQDAAMVGANLLVLHADRLGAYRMKETARAFWANRSRHCPDFLSGRAVTEREKPTRNP